MQPHLILVRHAAVKVDPTIDSHQWPLTADGRSATHQLAERLKPYQLQQIITSKEPKAQSTGAALSEVLNLPLKSAPGLQEHDRRGMPYFEDRGEFETAVTNFFARPDELVLGRETAVAATARFTQAVEQQLEAYPQTNLAIVTHGTVLTLFLCHYNRDLSPWQLWQSLTMPCAFIVSLPNMQISQSFFIE